ncbi:Transcriptional regulator, AcrR family [hydrothermal vent metagenome]|uniref:Transcriptional regulator, AcrR family n=1 Tax=hydrothermal vent metagenome TaxID=652676 RepID=A0A3B0TBR8_9ZZZZ
MKKPAVAKRNPEDTRRRLLQAARTVFSKRGLEGARVDDIAGLAGVNKQLVYYHFGNKQQLYLAVLEETYAKIRAEELQLDLAHLRPRQAMEQLICFTFDYYTKNPDFVPLLSDENLHEARNLRQSKIIQQLHSPLVEMIGETLRRGQRSGDFAMDVDPVQLYITIAGMGFFYYSNTHTLSVIFGRNLGAKAAVKTRRKHVIEFVMGALQAPPVA